METGRWLNSALRVALLALAVASSSGFMSHNSGHSQLQMVNVDKMDADCLPDEDILTTQMFECFEKMDVDVHDGNVRITFTNEASTDGMFCKIYNFTGAVQDRHTAKITTYVYDEDAVDHYYNNNPEVYQRLFQEEVEEAIEQEVAKEIDEELAAALKDPYSADQGKLEKKMYDIADAIAEAAEELLEENAAQHAGGNNHVARPHGLPGTRNSDGGDDESNEDVHDSVMFAKDGLIFWQFDDICTYTYKVVSNPNLLDAWDTVRTPAGYANAKLEF